MLYRVAQTDKLYERTIEKMGEYGYTDEQIENMSAALKSGNVGYLPFWGHVDPQMSGEYQRIIDESEIGYTADALDEFYGGINTRATQILLELRRKGLLISDESFSNIFGSKHNAYNNISLFELLLERCNDPEIVDLCNGVLRVSNLFDLFLMVNKPHFDLCLKAFLKFGHDSFPIFSIFSSLEKVYNFGRQEFEMMIGLKEIISDNQIKEIFSGKDTLNFVKKLFLNPEVDNQLMWRLFNSTSLSQRGFLIKLSKHPEYFDIELVRKYLDLGWGEKVFSDLSSSISIINFSPRLMRDLILHGSFNVIYQLFYPLKRASDNEPSSRNFRIMLHDNFLSKFPSDFNIATFVEESDGKTVDTFFKLPFQFIIEDFDSYLELVNDINNDEVNFNWLIKSFFPVVPGLRLSKDSYNRLKSLGMEKINEIIEWYKDRGFGDCHSMNMMKP